MLSVVIPSYNEEGNILRTAETIGRLLEENKINAELLFVDDGSTDGTWEAISAASQDLDYVRGLKFSRNFGKEAAIFAGLEASDGDCVVVIDCDLQHPPEKIVEMYDLWTRGYEIVEGVKAYRGKESAIHKAAAKSFYSIISKASGIDMDKSSDFKLLDRKAVNVLLNMREKNAFFRALSSWIGFKTTQIMYSVRERDIGTTKWSTKALIKYAISNITSFSSFPMQVVTFLGCVTLVFSLVFSIRTLIQKLSGEALGGFTTIIIMMGFIGSIIMISLGILGYYLAKIYEEVKGRPRYIVAETINGR